VTTTLAWLFVSRSHFLGGITQPHIDFHGHVHGMLVVLKGDFVLWIKLPSEKGQELAAEATGWPHLQRR
jgi:hypothetical protein